MAPFDCFISKRGEATLENRTMIQRMSSLRKGLFIYLFLVSSSAVSTLHACVYSYSAKLLPHSGTLKLGRGGWDQAPYLHFFYSFIVAVVITSEPFLVCVFTLALSSKCFYFASAPLNHCTHQPACVYRSAWLYSLIILSHSDRSAYHLVYQLTSSVNICWDGRSSCHHASRRQIVLISL